MGQTASARAEPAAIPCSGMDNAPPTRPPVIAPAVPHNKYSVALGLSRGVLAQPDKRARIDRGNKLFDNLFIIIYLLIYGIKLKRV